MNVLSLQNSISLIHTLFFIRKWKFSREPNHHHRVPLVKFNTQARWHLIFMREFSKRRILWCDENLPPCKRTRTWYFTTKPIKFYFPSSNTFLLLIDLESKWWLRVDEHEMIFMRTLVGGERLRQSVKKRSRNSGHEWTYIQIHYIENEEIFY